MVIPEAAGRQFRPLSDGEIQPALQRYDLGGPYVLYVGALTARKNVPRLLQAYARLRTWSTTWSLVIAGARNCKSAPIFRAVQELGLQEHVHFTAFVADEDLPALYNGADLFAFPSLYEGFGLPVMEAMACGTPVVTANTSSLPEVAGNAALLVDPYDVRAIAGAMRRVLEDGDLAQELRERGLARAAQFSWERTARATVTVYESVLATKSEDKGRS
jgi:glycosyltransferase involved in cell wall biosynthesis